MHRTPDVVANALLPLPIPVTGKIVFLPVTLGHVLLLSRFQSGALRGQCANIFDAARAAFILSRPYSESLAAVAAGDFDAQAKAFALAELAAVPAANLNILIYAALRAALAPDRARSFPGSTLQSVSIDECRGLGLILALISRLVEMPGVATLLAHGGTLYDLPLATAFALTLAEDIRNGAEFEGAPSYFEEMRLDDESAVRTAVRQCAVNRADHAERQQRVEQGGNKSPDHKTQEHQSDARA